MLGVKLRDDFLGFGENFRSFDGALVDWGFAMRTASVECKMNLVIFVAPIECVFHFVAVEKIFTIRDCRQNIGRNMLLAETFLN